ncbi:MAG: hypothetical protein HZC40_11195 [Chloroflexi bacterium]|nr:hypothetical protein [Chloroflexota bacterium]
MIQQVMVTSEAPVSIKPLLQAAIQNELYVLEHGIARTRERIAAFEKQYGMSTDTFARRFNGQDLKETLDFIDWSGEIKTLRLLEDKHRALAGARVN